jgi:hypothetical protein
VNEGHFTGVEATGSKVWIRGHIQLNDLPIEFHGNLQVVSELLVGTQTVGRQRDGHTSRQHSNLSLTYF